MSARHLAPATRTHAFIEAETAYQIVHLKNPTYGDKRGRHYATMSAWGERGRHYMTPRTIEANEELESRSRAARRP